MLNKFYTGADMDIIVMKPGAASKDLRYIIKKLGETGYRG